MALLCLILFNLNAFNNRVIVHEYLHGFFRFDSTPCIADSKPSIVTPPKINIEPENDGFQMENILFYMGPFVCSRG